MIDILVWGIGGNMGRRVCECAAQEEGVRIAGGVDKYADAAAFSVPVFRSGAEINVRADVVVDFSRPEALDDVLAYARRSGAAVLLATTGYDETQLAAIRRSAQELAVFKTSNLSLGVTLLTELCKKAAVFLGGAFDVEIVEHHHNRKVDAPSGTALSLAEAINDAAGGAKEFNCGRSGKEAPRRAAEIGLHAVRGGTVVGKHAVYFLGNDETVTLSHEAQSKTVFAAGAVRAAKFVARKPAGMYDMEDLVAELTV